MACCEGLLSDTKPVSCKDGCNTSTSPEPPMETMSPSTSMSPSPSSSTRLVICGKEQSSRNGRCCKDSRRSKDGSIVNPDTIRDIIIGLSDGLTVPFALTAGLSGVGSTHFVMLAGVAELISGSISMGIGGYLSARAELDHYKHQLRLTRDQVRTSCEKALVDDLSEILEPYGVPYELTVAMSLKLNEAEVAQSSRPTSFQFPSRFSYLIHSLSRKRRDVDLDVKMASGAKGFTPFLVQFGQGIEPVAESRAYASAFTIGISYILGGLIPLLPYIIIRKVQVALFVSIGITGFMLLVFGAIKQHFIGTPAGYRSYIWGAVSTLAIGGVAAAASWGIVHGIESSLNDT